MAAEKARDELCRWFLKQIVRVGDLFDAPLVHDDNKISQRQRLVLAMRDMNEGDVELLLKAAKLSPHPHAQEGVEGRQGLVQEQDWGSVTSALASATRCCWPPDNCAGIRSEYCVMATSSRNSIARLRRASLSTPFILSEKATLSTQERCGKSA